MLNMHGKAFINAAHLLLYFFAIFVQVKIRHGICFGTQLHSSMGLTGIIEVISGDFKKHHKFS